MTKDEAKTVCVQPAQEPIAWLATETVRWLREYDGPACAMRTAVHNRPITSDGGVPVYLKPAAQDGAEVELVTDADELRAELRRALAQIDRLDAECDRRHAQTEAAKNDVYRLAVAICGGEDFPGLLDAQPIEALVQEVKRQQAVHDETINVLLQAEAEVADLRHDLARLKASETDAINDVDRLMRLIRLAHPVMRECGWQLAPACAAEGSDGILEAACAEIEEKFGDMLRTDGVEAGQ